jgi:hypothetical protein
MQNWGLVYSSLLIRNNDCSSQVHEKPGVRMGQTQHLFSRLRPSAESMWFTINSEHVFV